MYLVNSMWHKCLAFDVADIVANLVAVISFNLFITLAYPVSTHYCQWYSIWSTPGHQSVRHALVYHWYILHLLALVTM